MKKILWHKFDKMLFDNQKLPPERKLVLVQIEEKKDKGLPPALAVGYLRFASDCKDSPGFIIPGVGGNVVFWADILPADLNPPLWPGFQNKA